MSKARVVITAIVVEGRTHGEVARAYGVSQGWISRLVARYRVEGGAAFGRESWGDAPRSDSRFAVSPDRRGRALASLLADVAIMPCRRSSHPTDFTTAFTQTVTCSDREADYGRRGEAQAS
jgi:hypothetical protein